MQTDTHGGVLGPIAILVLLVNKGFAAALSAGFARWAASIIALAVICQVAGATFYKGTTPFGESKLARAEDEKKAARVRLEMQQLDEDRILSKRKAAEADRDAQRIATELAKLKLEQTAAATKDAVAEKRLEEARLEYVRAHRKRIQLESDLIKSANGSDLLAYQSVSNIQYILERENSNATTIARRDMVRKRILTALVKDYASRKQRIMDSDELLEANENLLNKLKPLYARATTNVKTATLASIRKLTPSYFE